MRLGRARVVHGGSDGNDVIFLNLIAMTGTGDAASIRACTPLPPRRGGALRIGQDAGEHGEPTPLIPEETMGSRTIRIRRVLVVGIFGTFALAGCGGGDVPLPALSPSTVGDTMGLTARGEYLVRSVA